MSDFEKLINASDLIEWIIETCPDWCEGAIRSIVDHIDEMPPTQPEQRWIPCSKMEPKKSGYYLCTHDGTGIVSSDYYTTQEQAEELFADPEDEYLDLKEYIGWTSKNVIAWMPQPAPYEERREGGDK